MTTLLYHAKTNGAICKRIAATSNDGIQAICDKQLLPERFDGTLVRWDSRAEVEADRTINSAGAVKLSRNKQASRFLLADLCPPTWFGREDCEFPCVVRPGRHFGGNKFYLCNTPDELKTAIKRCGKHWYAARFIEKVSEYRVFVLNGEVFKVVRRFRDDGDPKLPWNHHEGGKTSRVKQTNWPTGVIDYAKRTSAILNLQLCAVDVIVDGEGAFFVLEANTAPGLNRDGTIKKFAKLLGGLA